MRFNIDIVGKTSGVKATTDELTSLERALRKDAAAIRALEQAKARLSKSGRLTTETEGRLNGALGKLQTRLLKNTEAFAAGASGVDRFKDNTEDAISKAGVLGGIAGAITAKLIELAAAAARAAAQLAIAFGRKIVQGAVFLESTTKTFDRLLGGGLGAETLERITKLAAELGLNVQATTEQFRDLLLAKFSATDAEDIVKLAADMQSLGADANKVASIIRALGQIKGKGKLQLEELQQQLAETGISTKAVIDELAKSLGKSSDEIRKMISAGEISAEVGIEAIKNAVKAQLGISELGEAARDAGNTLAGMWNRVIAGAELFMLKISQKILPVLQEQFGPLLEQALEALESPEAEAVINAIAGALTFVAEAVAAIVPLFQKFAEGFAEGFAAGAPGLGEAAQLILDLLKIEAVSDAFKIFGQVIGFIVGALTQMVAVVAIVMGGLTAFVGLVGQFFEAAAELGSSIIDGIVSGIQAGASAVVDSIVGVAQSAIDAAKSHLGIASPSKVFEEMGMQAAAGFGGGLESSAPDAQQSARSVVAPPTPRSITNISRGPVTLAPVFTISGAMDPEKIGIIIDQRMGAMLEKMA